MNNDDEDPSKTIVNYPSYSLFDEKIRSKAQQIIFEEHVKKVVEVFNQMRDEQEKW